MAEVTVTVPPRAQTGTATVRDPAVSATEAYFARCDTCGWLFRVQTPQAARVAARFHSHPRVIVEVVARG